MKKFKKIMALVIAMVMVLSMSMAVFATDTDPATGDGDTQQETTTPATKGSIDLTGGKAGHTYTLYQIFTGKVDGDQLIDIQWGADAPAALKTQYATAAAAAKAIADQDDARAFAQGLTLSGGTSKNLDADGNVTFSDLTAGYYVIKDTNGNTEAVVGDYSSAIIVKVVGEVTGKLKGSAPSSEKKVADNNDSSKVQPDLSGLQDTDWEDSADYDIGDDVPFKLKATTADNVAAYTKYHVTFQDKQSAGLASPENISVTVLGQTLNVGDTKTTANGTKITVANGTPDSGNTFAITVTFEQANPTKDDNNNITSYLNAECNSTDIIVKYTSKLTGNDVVIGKPGNPNEMYIKYSNNPEDKDDQEEGKTKEDKVVVFTYKTVIDKVDETGADLKGADFTLYKEVPEGTTGATKGDALTFANGVEHTKIDAAKYYVVAGTKTGTTAGSQFKFKGIDDGTYVLVETTVPTGYNAFKSVVVTVSAEHSQGDDPVLTSLTATAPFTETNADAGTVDRKKEGTTHSRVSGEAYAEIENNSGAELPSTGGIGTTIFYILGAILVLGAGIVLVTRRRMSAN